MLNELPCKKCGAMILSDTFIKTGGYCMQHKGGIKGIIGKLTINTLLLFFKREAIGLGKSINEFKDKIENPPEKERVEDCSLEGKHPALTYKIDEFTSKALKGSAQCCVQITEVADVLDSLYSKHKDVPGIDEGANYINMVYKKLKGSCPKCGTSSHARDLYLILTARNMGRKNMSFASGVTPGFVDGRCINNSCSCNKVNLYWKG